MIQSLIDFDVKNVSLSSFPLFHYKEFQYYLGAQRVRKKDYETKLNANLSRMQNYNIPVLTVSMLSCGRTDRRTWQNCKNSWDYETLKNRVAHLQTAAQSQQRTNDASG